MKRLALICIVLFGVFAPHPAAARVLDPQAADALVARRMELYDIPGAGLALVQNDQIVYTQGYGVRSTETGEPVTPDSVFSIGSLTKSFTALALAQLVDQGLIDLDLPVIVYWPDFKLSDPTATQTVTVRQLLAQTTGLPGTYDRAWYYGELTTTAEAAVYAAEIPLAAAPGTQHIYDNYNYAIAGYLIELVTGQDWEDYIREHIAGPLGMTSVSFDIEALQQSPDYAAPHKLDISNGMQPITPVSLAGIAPAGAMNASVRDMANYLLLQLSDGTFNGQPLVSADLLTEMHTEQIATPSPYPIGPTNFQSTGYALGWVTATFDDYATVWHNGSIDGYYALMVYVPSEEVGVVVLTNASLGNGSLFALATCMGLIEQMLGLDMGRDVADALNEEAGFVPADRQSMLDTARSYQADPADWDVLVGDYTSIAGPISIEVQEDKLYLNTEAENIELVPFKPGEFLLVDPQTPMLFEATSFEIDENGTVTMYQSGMQVAQKLGAGVEAAIYADPDGYFTVPIPAGLTVTESNGIGVLTSTDPAGTFYVGAWNAASGMLEAAGTAFNQLIDPAVVGEAIDMRDVPMPNGPTWTQSIYQLQDGQLRVIISMQQDAIAYFIGIDATPDNLQALVPALNTLLLNFAITTP